VFDIKFAAIFMIYLNIKHQMTNSSGSLADYKISSANHHQRYRRQHAMASADGMYVDRINTHRNK
jgi:hypothetical protein